MKSSDLALIYLGKRGGGSLLTLQMKLELDGINPFLIVASSNDELENFPSLEDILTVEIPSKFFYLINPFTMYKIISKIGHELRLRNVKKAFFVMPHPYDLFISLLVKKRITTYHLIHDYPPHPSEIFPGRFFSWLLIKVAHNVVVLSDYVASQIKNYLNISPVRIQFPPYDKSALLKSHDSNFSIYDAKRILLIGRNSKYKGIDLGIQSLIESKFSGRVIIAGGLAKNAKVVPEFEFHNGWLTRKELENLIFNADALFLPYTSATQSGLIPIAIYYNKWIIATDVGALSEQLTDYPNAIICKTATLKDITEAINQFDSNANDLALNRELINKWSKEFAKEILL